MVKLKLTHIRKEFEQLPISNEFTLIAYHNSKNVMLMHNEYKTFHRTHWNKINDVNYRPTIASCINQEHKKKYFTLLSKSIHGEGLNYDKVDYVNASTPVIVTCEHGDYNVTYCSHINQKKLGCRKCKHKKNVVEKKIIDFKNHKFSRFYRLIKYVNSSNIYVQKKSTGDYHCISWLSISNNHKPSRLTLVPNEKIKQFL